MHVNNLQYGGLKKVIHLLWKDDRREVMPQSTILSLDHYTMASKSEQQIGVILSIYLE